MDCCQYLNSLWEGKNTMKRVNYRVLHALPQRSKITTQKLQNPLILAADANQSVLLCYHNFKV